MLGLYRTSGRDAVFRAAVPRLPPVALIGAVLAVLAVLAAAPPALAAPVLDPLHRCYVSADAAQRELVSVRATGFSGGAYVDALIDGELQTQTGVQADASGRIEAEIPAPFQARGQRPFRLDLVERGNPANTVTGTAKVTALGVRLKPRRARPSQVVRYRGRGFLDQRPVFAHYLYDGRVRRTVRLGTPRHACGVFAARARQLPIRRPRLGTWTVQIDQERRYGPAPQPVHVVLTIEVREGARQGRG
jgi:hypothetical protein